MSKHNSSKLEPVANSSLLEAAVEVTVDGQWLTRLRVVREEEGEKEETFLLTRDTDVHQVKVLLSEHYGSPLHHVRLLSGTGENVLFGPIFRDDTDTVERKIRLSTTPIDARLEALYHMVSLDSIKERDWIMHHALTARQPRQCPGGHDLTTEINQENAELFLPLSCAICYKDIYGRYSVGGRAVTWMACIACGFTLCSQCLDADIGRPAVAIEDCYQSLQTMAVDLGRERAKIAAGFGGKGHLCGIPSVRWRHELGPKAYQIDDFTVRHHNPVGSRGQLDLHVKNVHRSTAVLHPGARLRVVLSTELQSVLTPEECRTIEVDEVRDQGAACGDIIRYKRPLSKWSDSDVLFRKINSHYRNKFPSYRTMDGDIAEAYISCRLDSFDVEGAVFQLDAHIDDGDC